MREFKAKLNHAIVYKDVCGKSKSIRSGEQVTIRLIPGGQIFIDDQGNDYVSGEINHVIVRDGICIDVDPSEFYTTD